MVNWPVLKLVGVTRCRQLLIVAKVFAVVCGFLLFSTFSSCSNYYVKPYEKGSVSKALRGQVVLSTISFLDQAGNSRTNFIDYIYIGANDHELIFELREYFNERSGSPQVKKEVRQKVEPLIGEITLGKSKIKIYVATDDELVFRIIET